MSKKEYKKSKNSKILKAAGAAGLVLGGTMMVANMVLAAEAEEVTNALEEQQSKETDQVLEEMLEEQQTQKVQAEISAEDLLAPAESETDPLFADEEVPASENDSAAIATSESENTSESQSESVPASENSGMRFATSESESAEVLTSETGTEKTLVYSILNDSYEGGGYDSGNP